MEKPIQTSQILTIRQIRAQNLEATLLFVDFSQAFDSIFRGKMEQILLGCGLSKETVAAIMIFYKIMKTKVPSLDGITVFFDIAAGVQLGDTFAPYLFKIFLNYVLLTSINLMKKMALHLKKKKRQEEDDTPQKLLRTQNTQMTYSYWQTHRPKPNPRSTVWSRQQVTLASM